jgi:hypothetical protein
MAGGAAVGAAGTASAAAPASLATHDSRDWCDHRGWWHDDDDCHSHGDFDNGDGVLIIVVG